MFVDDVVETPRGIDGSESAAPEDKLRDHWVIAISHAIVRNRRSFTRVPTIL
jgi:hypothetical protein